MIRHALVMWWAISAVTAQVDETLDEVLCEAPVVASDTARAPIAEDEDALSEPQLTAIRRAPLGTLAVADESLETFEIFGLDLAVDQGRRVELDEIDTQIVPILVDVDGAEASLHGMRLWQSDRVIPLVTIEVPLDDEDDGLTLALELESVSLSLFSSSHRAGLSRQRWALVPARMAWTTARGGAVVSRSTFDLDSGTGVIDEALVDAWTIALDEDDADAHNAVPALAAEESIGDDASTSVSVWRRLDEHTSTFLAAAHIGSLVPRVTLETSGPKRLFEDVAVTRVAMRLDRRGDLYEVVTLAARAATWEGIDDGSARLPADG